MSPSDPPPEVPRFQRAAAYGVHLFTATGAILAVLALQAALDRRFDLVFLWLGIASIVDGIDGTFARWLHVSERAPRFDGAVLDLVVDYVTYVFVPAIVLVMADVLPPAWETPLVALMAFTAALYFADTHMKTDEGGFRGFPAVWNVVVFYLVVFHPPAWASALILVMLSALQFAPIDFVHPVRVRRLRFVNLALLGLWTVACLVVVASWERPPGWALTVLLATGAWFMTVGAVRVRRP